jgi:hypothetical protein
MKGALKEIWDDAKTPMDYVIALWIYGLVGLAAIGMLKMLFEIVTNPYQFNGLKFGIFDYV